MFDDAYLKSRAHRAIPRKSPFHFVGQLSFLNGEGKSQAVGFNSLLEYHVALCCIAEPNFFDIEEQLAHIMVRRSGPVATPYWFDYRVTYKTGLRVAIAVKPEKEADTYKFRQDMQAIRAAAVPQVADQLCVVTERNIAPDILANAKLFHAARFPDDAIDPQVGAALNQLSYAMPVREFLAKCGVGSNGFWSVVRLIRAGAVVVRSPGPIDEHSLIVATAA